MNDYSADLAHARVYLKEAEECLKLKQYTNAAVYLNSLSLAVNALRAYTHAAGVEQARSKPAPLP